MARRPPLKGLSIEELIDLRDEVQAQIGDRIEIERAELTERMERLAALQKGSGEAEGSKRSGRRRRSPSGSDGGSEADVPAGSVVSRSGRTRAKAVPKYRGPNGETWTGRGRAPRWLTALEAEGNARDSYRLTQD